MGRPARKHIGVYTSVLALWPCSELPPFDSRPFDGGILRLHLIFRFAKISILSLMPEG